MRFSIVNLRNGYWFGIVAAYSYSYCTTKAYMAKEVGWIPKTQRLLNVRGLEQRCNDVIFVGRQYQHLPTTADVIFFGGDVQDYPENMMAHRDNHRYVKWNLEYTAQLMAMAFPQSDVFVVKPSRMYIKTFSVYENFVESNPTGAPTHSPDQHAIEHLQLIITSAKTKLCRHQQNSESDDTCHQQKDEETKCHCEPLEHSVDVPLILVGFSKGCVVLNQIVYELEKAKQDPHLQSFIDSFKAIYWLDGGHAGGSCVWIMDSKLHKILAESGIELHVHVSPYQMKDLQRPWIAREEKIFSDSLNRLKAKFRRVSHFQEEPASIEFHFRVLEEFLKQT